MSSAFSLFIRRRCTWKTLGFQLWISSTGPEQISGEEVYIKFICLKVYGSKGETPSTLLFSSELDGHPPWFHRYCSICPYWFYIPPMAPTHRSNTFHKGLCKGWVIVTEFPQPRVSNCPIYQEVTKTICIWTYNSHYLCMYVGMYVCMYVCMSVM